jgi:NAD(P)H-flavin reductase
LHSKRKENPAYAKDIGMICAGTGITPIWQILKAISDEDRHNDYAATRISLIYGNRHEEDIILRRELQEIQRNLGPSNFSMR